ncbi:MAG: fructosamine kinase family protein [Opitutales bacterium]|nr:fructosamine kinase family protein [Opitutales bacterium]MCH8540411.1 fructosamine kinase family protein [Opitutales bacterium]
MMKALCEKLSDHLGREIVYRGEVPIGGGCIHQAVRLETNAGSFFVKQNDASCLPQFVAEAKNLAELAATKTIVVPTPVFETELEGRAFFVLSYLKFGPTPADGGVRMGEKLADLHACGADRFGWDEDNFIGSTPQPNGWCESWPEFFARYRLGAMQKKLTAIGEEFNGLSELIAKVDTFFDDHEPEPSLLHGDLWGGNAGFREDGEPVLFDPAAYYGHDEADLAFTEMFGGFSKEFYDAYHRKRPRRPGYPRRKELYNLYHLLNHTLLFGGAYGSQARRVIHVLLQ